MEPNVRLLARLCWTVHARRELIVGADLGGAFLFVLGCIAFYVPSQYTTGVTLFLLGSILMLVSVAGRALLQYGPSE